MAPISDIERQVFADIYETYSGKLYGVCLHYVKDHEIAEDLLHDSFIVIFAGIGSLRDPARLESWMCSIVRNIAFKHLKVSQRLQETNIESIPEPILEESTTHFTEIPLDDLLEVVDSLPEQYGNVFKLAVLEGLSHKEIGAILGIAPHSSSSNLTRAKQMLRKVISKNWGILLTFCLCIVAMLFMLKPDTTKNITVDSNEIQLIPAERSEIYIAEVRKAEALKSIAAKMAASEQAETETEAGAEVEAEVEPEKSIVFPEDTVVKKSEKPSRFEHNDIFDEPAERSRRSGSLRFSFGGNLGRSADGKMLTHFPTSSPGQTGTTYPPYPGIGDVTSSIPGTTTPPDSGYEEGGNDNTEGGNASGRPGSVTKFRHALPISFNAAVTYSFADGWMLTSGLRYTYLHSDITNISDGSEYGQDIHYLGIPLKLSWTFWESYHMKSYVSAVAAFEFPIYSRIGVRRLDAPCQWSAGLGIGLQYDITPHIGIYIEPELNRYFDNGSQIETVRSERPLTLTLPMGIRFSL